MRIIQFIDEQGSIRVGIAIDDRSINAIEGDNSVYTLAQQAIETKTSNRVN